MKRIPVKSSSINSIGYDIIEQILEVEFTRGAIYQYEDVPAFRVVEFIFADSVGKYFSQNIKNNFKYRKII
ncbi:MAG: KTSC domain-containing protein [Candidatus Thorarchaeota archaeon]|jgi:hypothetical protein